MKNGFYNELDILRIDAPDANFEFLEVALDSDINFLHGFCIDFALCLSDMFGYSIETVRNEHDDLIHAYCVSQDGRNYIDVRGITDEPKLFFDEFADEVTYLDGELWCLADLAKVETFGNSQEYLAKHPIDDLQLEQARACINDNFNYYQLNDLLKGENSMKIERNPDGMGMVLTNSVGGSLNVSWSEFWDICSAGVQMDTKDEVESYLSDCDQIGEYDIQRIRAFPSLIDKITEQVIKDRIDDEHGDQIYNAAQKCIGEHIAELESKVKWFELSEDKCISVWYAPDEHDGDQFQMHLEEKGGDGYMGPACEVLSDESYATNDISLEALCETLSEIYDDAGIYFDDDHDEYETILCVALDIRRDFGLSDRTKMSLDSVITDAQKRSEAAENRENIPINDELSK